MSSKISIGGRLIGTTLAVIGVGGVFVGSVTGIIAGAAGLYSYFFCAH